MPDDNDSQVGDADEPPAQSQSERPQKVDGEGEGQWKRFDPSTHDHVPPQRSRMPEPEGGDVTDAMLQMIEPMLTEEEMASHASDAWGRYEELQLEKEDRDEPTDDPDEPTGDSNGEWETSKPATRVRMPDGTFREFEGDFEKVDPSKYPRDRTKLVLVVGGIVGAIGLVVGAMTLLPDGDEPDAPVGDSADAQESEGGESDGSEQTDPISENDQAGDTQEPVVSVNLPDGFQPDTTGRRPSRRDDEDDEEVDEIPADTDGARNSNILGTNSTAGSYVFSMIVEGDGEAQSQDEFTSYQISFIVNNDWPENEFRDPTGFAVLVQWNKQAAEYGTAIIDAGRSPIGEFDAEVVWLDRSTLQVTVDIPGHDVIVTEMRTELDVLIQDENEVFLGQYRDVAIWLADA